MAIREYEKLPQEIIIEILSRLPAKFIGQCRCVSKQWLNFLSDPQFVKAQFNIHVHKEEEEEEEEEEAEKEEQLIWVSDSHSIFTSTFKHDIQIGTLAIPKKLNFQHLPDNWSSIAGSCNGLVLAENLERTLFLLNPITLKYHTIPSFHLALPVDHSFSMYGLGYDSSADDYKVVTLSEYDETYHNNSIFVDVYSERNGLWRRLECLPHDYELVKLDSGVFVNGALHWLAAKYTDHSYGIVAFDLSGEKFLKLPAPTTLDKPSIGFHKLVARRGCLCLFTGTEDYNVDVWTMKEYGVEESWTKFSFISPESFYGQALLSTNEHGAVVNVYGEWVVYTKDDHREFYLHESSGAVTFIESLVNPTFSNGT